MNKKILSKIPLLDAGNNLVNIAKRMNGNNIKYFAVGRITNAANKKTLVLHFYLRTQLENGSTKAQFRTFITKNDYITQKLDCEGVKWLTGSLDYIIPNYDSNNGYLGYWRTNTYLADDKTTAAIQYFAGTDKPPFEALEKYQRVIKAARLAKKHKVIMDGIDEKMELIPAMPKDFNKWLDTTGFAKRRYIFYWYKSWRKKQQGYCAACHSPVEVEKPRHNQEGVCPLCGKKVTFKATGKSRNVFDRIQAVVFQKTSPGFVIRYLQVSRKYKDFRQPVFSVFECNRNFYEDGKVHLYNFGKFKQTDIYRWCENNYGYGEPSAVICEKGLCEAVAGTKWQYCAVSQYAERFGEGAHVNVHWYMNRYIQYPFIEYMVKIGLYNLVDAMVQNNYTTRRINEKGSTMTEILGVKKQYLKLMKEMDIESGHLELMQQLSNADIPATAESFRDIVKLYGGVYDAVKAVKMAKYASLERIENYCKKRVNNKNSFGSIFRLWNDYIESCEKLPEYDLTNDFVVFPRHLKKAHDTAYLRVQSNKHAGDIEKFSEITKEFTEYLAELQNKYGFENDVYEIIAPSNFADIIKEGYTLRHCVGGYAEDAVAKKTVILFVRLKKNRDVPFYTMEIQDGNVRQCRGKRNRDMTNPLKKFVELFKQKVLPVKEPKRAG